MSDQEIIETLNSQISYFKTTSFKSYDLCDITSQKYFLKMNERCADKKIGKYIKYPHNLLIRYFTPILRSYYKIKKKDFAQSNSFIVRGLLNLYQYTNNHEYLDEAEKLIMRIKEQKTNGYAHACWGQPYDWFSGKIIPAYTPRTTVTSQVGRMFLEAFQTTQKKEYLEWAIDIGDFFLEEMPLSFNENSQTCYSYTTIDTHRVHNPNMMASAFLAMLWNITKEKKYLDRALTCAAFTFTHIKSDGSWFYALLPQNKPSKIDNYHTGYIIEASLLLKRILNESFPYHDELSRAITYYESFLFDDKGIPYLTNKKKFPIDIQCCAQSIITFAQLSQWDTHYYQRAVRLFFWTKKNMFNEGYYYYRIFKRGSKDRTAFIRWGDSWMFYGASLLLKNNDD